MPLQKRPPIIVVVGHVDHGKTTLLDYIRKANVAAREAGGITQSIGAYEIEHRATGSGQAQKITFIDTPGHEAFMGMRARGAKIADVAILVVSADDGVQNQTKEAIGVLQQTNTPFVVAITKIDRGGDINKVKNELTQAHILLEGYGGTVSWHGVSAKTGEGVNELLDLIVLTAELQNAEYEPSHPGTGYIIEARKDNRKGIMAHAIITDGTVRIGDTVAVGHVPAKIRSLENFRGERVTSAQPSSPVAIIGFKEIPPVGERFVVGGTLTTEEITPRALPQKLPVDNEGKTVFDLMIKADTSGSLEALSTVIKNIPIPEQYSIRIINEGVGEITDGDIKWLTATSGGVYAVVGFNVTSTKGAENLAQAHKISILTSGIIYDVVQQLEKLIKQRGGEVIVGDLEVCAVFGKKEGKRQIIGGKVVMGEMRVGAACALRRNGSDVAVGRIVNLQQQKQDAVSVPGGSECGLLVEADSDIRVGDHLIIK